MQDSCEESGKDPDGQGLQIAEAAEEYRVGAHFRQVLAEVAPSTLLAYPPGHAMQAVAPSAE
jgi:hypothetical protein